MLKLGNLPKEEETKWELEGKTFIIKKKSCESYPAAYYEYFNQQEDSDYDGPQSEAAHDNSVITVLENNGWGRRSIWEEDNEENHSDLENDSIDDVKTYRISNSCTPIDDLDNIPSSINTSFLLKDNSKKHIINNLFYGNYRENPKSKFPIFTALLEETRSRQSKQTNLLESLSHNSKPQGFTNLKTYNYAKKLITATSKKTSANNSCLVESVTPAPLNKSKLTGSLENFKTVQPDISLFLGSAKDVKQ